jgi:hypothetical protein
VPEWPPFTPGPEVEGVAALTGTARRPRTVTSRPVLAVKIDNYGPAATAVGPRSGRRGSSRRTSRGSPASWPSSTADSPTSSGRFGSARTEDLDLLSALNRPVFGLLGCQCRRQGVDRCCGRFRVCSSTSPHKATVVYVRTPERPGPHNLLLDPACAMASAPGRRCGATGVDHGDLVDRTQPRRHCRRHDVRVGHGWRSRRLDLGQQLPASTCDRRTVNRT